MSRNIAPFVVVESPYAGDIERNVRYARACIRDCILRGEAPFASHLLYTQEGVLRDEVPAERELGMGLGWQVLQKADKQVIYTDLGWSSGMVRGFNASLISPEIRRLGGEWAAIRESKLSEHIYCRGSSGYSQPGVPAEWQRMLVKRDGVIYPSDVYLEVDCVLGYGVRGLRGPAGELTGDVEIVKGVFTLEMREAKAGAA